LGLMVLGNLLRVKGNQGGGGDKVLPRGGRHSPSQPSGQNWGKHKADERRLVVDLLSRWAWINCPGAETLKVKTGEEAKGP